MWKPLAAVTFAALVAGAITGFPVVSQEATAGAVIEQSKPQLAPACNERGWPYTNCGQVRVVTTDRLALN